MNKTKEQVMDYEKAYKKALERARISRLQLLDIGEEATEIEHIFPELVESDDERIRKELVDFLQETIDNVGESPNIWTMNNAKKWIAWLEKQKPVEHFELKAGHWYFCHRAFCCRADDLTVKEGERFMCEEDGVVKGFIFKEPEKYFMEIDAPESHDEKQKPVEWNEGDIANIDNIIWLCENSEKGIEITWLPTQAREIKKLMETIKQAMMEE